MQDVDKIRLTKLETDSETNNETIHEVCRYVDYMAVKVKDLETEINVLKQRVEELEEAGE